MIDNQADYDRIFRPKARVTRSPGHQTVSTQPTVPSSSSTGFPIETPSTTEVSSVRAAVVAKPKTSQSVSPPPQVISIFFFFTYTKLLFFNERLIY